MCTNSIYCIQTTLAMVKFINYTYLHIAQAFILITTVTESLVTFL